MTIIEGKCVLCNADSDGNSMAGLPVCEKHNVMSNAKKVMQVLNVAKSNGSLKKYLCQTLTKTS